MLAPLAVLFADAEIVLGMLIEIFRGHPVVADGGFPSEGDVALEYLMSAAANFDAGAVAVETLVSLLRTRLLLKWSIAVVAPAWALI